MFTKTSCGKMRESTATGLKQERNTSKKEKSVASWKTCHETKPKMAAVNSQRCHGRPKARSRKTTSQPSQGRDIAMAMNRSRWKPIANSLKSSAKDASFAPCRANNKTRSNVQPTMSVNDRNATKPKRL